MNTQTLFIADLHLAPSTPKTTELFFQFLETIPENTVAIYILGDLFKFWIGDDDRSNFNEEVKKTLKKTSLKAQIYLMPGNRDFLLGKIFADESDCTLIPDHHVIDLYGIKTVLTHGDLLCTKDYRYQIFRNIIRLPGAIKLFLMLPLSLRLWMAKTIQKHSAKTKITKNKDLLSAQPEPVKKLLTETNATQIIHGHVHIAEIEELEINNSKARRISLGEWNDTGSVLIYLDSGIFKFEISKN